MATHPRLKKRGSVYYFRARVPVDLLEHYAPRKEITFSLRTSDPGKALEKVRVEAVKLDQEFAAARRCVHEQPIIEISDVEVERLGALVLHNLLKEDEESRFDGDPGGDKVYRKAYEDLERRGVEFRGPTIEQSTARFGLSERALGQMRFVDQLVFPKIGEALARGDLSVVEEETNELLEENGYSLEVGSEPWRRVAAAVLRAWVKAGDLVAMRYAGQVVETPPAPASSATVVQLRENGHENGHESDSISLSGLWDLYRDERQLKTKTASDFATQVRRFIEVNGDLPVNQVKPEHVRAFKDALLKMPARVSGNLRGMTVPEIVRALEGRNDINRLSARTINDKALGAVSAIFGYAVENGYRDDNPAQRIRASGPKATGPARIGYSIDDLNLIFSSPVFAAGARPQGGGGEAAKWLPLLALFTGARMEELGQLDVADVGEEHGVDHFFIHSGLHGEKSLKTESSRRKVPIHPELVRLAFLDYVAERRAKEGASGRLFPDLTSNQTEVTAGFSKWWGRYIRALGITDRRKVFHSFRHLVKRRLRDGGVDKTLRDAILGHAATDVAELYGRDEEGLGISLPTLCQAMVKLDYPGLKLTHLYVT